LIENHFNRYMHIFSRQNPTPASEPLILRSISQSSSDLKLPIREEMYFAAKIAASAGTPVPQTAGLRHA
jgi:hypothetical protein